MSPATILLLRAPNDGFYAPRAGTAPTIVLVEFAGRAFCSLNHARAQLNASLCRTPSTAEALRTRAELRPGLPTAGARALVGNDSPEAIAALKDALSRPGWHALGPCTEVEAAEYRHDLNADRRPGQTPSAHPSPLPAPAF